MKKIASLLLAAILIFALLSVPASAAGIKVAIAPDQNQNIILDSTGGYTVVSGCTLQNLEIRSGSITIDRNIEVTVTDSLIIAEGATLNIYGKLIVSESAAVQIAGTVNKMCCGNIIGNADVSNKANASVHTFDGSKNCTDCGTECPHSNVFTFCADCGAVIANGNHLNGISYNLPAGAEIGTIGPALNTGPAMPQSIEGTTDTGGIIGGLVTASVLGDGKFTIITGIACLAIGFLAAMFIFKKKKTAAPESEN